MENLRLRVSKDAQSEVLKLMEILKNQIQKNAKQLNWHVYRHARISGDFSILIHWDTAQANPEGSMLAYNLIRILSPLGMVDHSIWIEQRSLKEGRGCFSLHR
jgi:hypothetical protein